MSVMYNMSEYLLIGTMQEHTFYTLFYFIFTDSFVYQKVIVERPA